MSGINVARVADGDIPRCFQVLSDSFGHGAPFVDAYFPNHGTSSGRIQGSKRLQTWKNTSESSVFLKATTGSRGHPGEELVVGFAVWTHMKEPPPAELEDDEDVEDVEEVWPDRQDREFMAQLWRDYVKPRTQVVKDAGGKGVYVLELLAVHPDYQGLGAGKALVEWGTAAADRLGVRAVVEGTPAGRRLYEKCGLRVEIEQMEFRTGEEFAARAKPKLFFMTREPVVPCSTPG